MTFRVQELIHKWEVGAGQGLVKTVAAILAFIGLAVWYDVRVFKGLSTREGMDAAQVARNLSQGQGYTTRFIRPFSVFLVRSKAAPAEQSATPEGSTNSSSASVQGGSNPVQPGKRHPDLANAPIYPTLLAGALKLMPFDYPDLLALRTFTVFAPDLWIAGFNQLLFLLALFLTFRLARSLFDEGVAWLSVVAVAGTELFWQFTGTGDSSMLLVVLLLGLLTLLAALDRIAREPEAAGAKNAMLLAVASGIVIGVAGLTRYSFGLLIVPVIGWMALLPSPRKTTWATVAAVAFLAVLLPWILRNFIVSGTPFGTATYTFAAGTTYFPGDELWRSLVADLNRIELGDVWGKLTRHSADLVVNRVADFGGTWLTALFVIGLLVPFRNPTLGRLRWLLVLFVFVFAVAEGIGRVPPMVGSEASVSDDLLGTLGPAVLIFGFGFLLILLQGLAAPALRMLAVGVVVVLSWFPLLRSLLSDQVPSRYYPPAIQDKCASTTGHLLMTDMPWATAWYANQQSVWLALKHQDAAGQQTGNDFYAFHAVLPISGLYLADKVLNSIDTAAVAQWRDDTSTRQGEDWNEFLQLASGLMKGLEGANRQEEVGTLRRLLQVADQHWAYGTEGDWADFMLGVFINREVPAAFPLRRAPFGLWPELFLTETERKAAE